MQQLLHQFTTFHYYYWYISRSATACIGGNWKEVMNPFRRWITCSVLEHSITVLKKSNGIKGNKSAFNYATLLRIVMIHYLNKLLRRNSAVALHLTARYFMNAALLCDFFAVPKRVFLFLIAIIINN